jgi:hypothetical protein
MRVIELREMNKEYFLRMTFDDGDDSLVKYCDHCLVHGSRERSDRRER